MMQLKVSKIFYVLVVIQLFGCKLQEVNFDVSLASHEKVISSSVDEYFVYVADLVFNKKINVKKGKVVLDTLNMESREILDKDVFFVGKLNELKNKTGVWDGFNGSNRIARIVFIENGEGQSKPISAKVWGKNGKVIKNVQYSVIE